MTLDPSLASGLVDGLTYLEHFPYECTEQTVSRFLPNLFTVQALRELGIDDRAGGAALLPAGHRRPDPAQPAEPATAAGASGRRRKQAFITAYVLWGLSTPTRWATRSTQSTVDRAVAYLDSQFVAPDEVQRLQQLNEMAFMNYVLASMGTGDAGRISTLYDVRERLNPYGQALLAMAMHEMDATRPAHPDLAGRPGGAAVLSATGAFWRSDPIDFQTMGTDQRATAMVLDAFGTSGPTSRSCPTWCAG